MRARVVALLVPLALFAAACGAGEPRTGGESTVGTRPPGASGTAKTLYEVDALVLADETHGPTLCLGGVLESLPPQCGDVPIAGWDWQAVEGEERMSGTTWGAYHVVGSYDGETFTVTDVGRAQDASGFGDDPDFSSPCEEPQAGWTGLEHVTQEDARPAHDYARSQPDYVTSWNTHQEPARHESGPVIVNALFTGDADRHEAAMRDVWGGPLCVVERDVPSARELARIRRDAEASLDALGVRMLWSAGPAVEPLVEIGVIVDPGGRAQAALDARYGPGIIRLVSALERAS